MLVQLKSISFFFLFFFVQIRRREKWRLRRCVNEYFFKLFFLFAVYKIVCEVENERERETERIPPLQSKRVVAIIKWSEAGGVFPRPNDCRIKLPPISRKCSKERQNEFRTQRWRLERKDGGANKRTRRRGDEVTVEGVKGERRGRRWRDGDTRERSTLTLCPFPGRKQSGYL